MKMIVNMLLSIPKLLIASFILTKTWDWFIASKFGLPHLSIVDGVGLMFVAQLIYLPLQTASIKADMLRKNPNADSDTYDIYISVAMMLVVYPLCFLSAYIWHQFQ